MDSFWLWCTVIKREKGNKAGVSGSRVLSGWQSFLSFFALHSLDSGTPFHFTIQNLRENSAFSKTTYPSPLMVNKSHSWKSKDAIKTTAHCLALTLQNTQKQLMGRILLCFSGTWSSLEYNSKGFIYTRMLQLPAYLKWYLLLQGWGVLSTSLQHVSL